MPYHETIGYQRTETSFGAIVGCLNGIAVVWFYHLDKDWQYMAFLSLFLLAIANMDRGRK